MTAPEASRITGRVILGGVLILFGLVFLLDNMGILDAGAVLRFWPLILIGIGLFKVLQPRDQGHRAVGVGMIAIGVFILLQTLAIGDWDFGDLWPVVLVVLGAVVLWRSLGRDRRGARAASSASDLSEFAMMGGVNRVIASQEFRGGEVTAVMGGVEIDLRHAAIGPEPAVIDVFAMWGGIEIKVPPEWSVDVKGLPIMRGFENTTRPSVTDPALAQKLIVRGTAIMGGVEVKN